MPINLKNITGTGKTNFKVVNGVGGINVKTPAAPSSIVASGLVFNLQTAPSSGTTWTDATGNGYNATLQGTASYTGSFGGGIKLNNALSTGTDYISVPYNISTNTTTIEVVASFNPTAYWATIWGNESYTAGNGYFAYMLSIHGQQCMIHYPK